MSAPGESRPVAQTRERIQDVARELFVVKGVQRTSLQDIASRLGISKPALYHHFRSRDDLVRSIIEPFIDDGERVVAAFEALPERPTPRELLEGDFDFHYRHRADLVLVVSELTTVADLGFVDAMLGWRDRLSRLVFGDDMTLEQATRAIIAFGGLQDCVLQFPDTDHDDLRRTVVDGALVALGV